MAGNAKYNLHLRYIYTYMLLYKYMCEIVLGTGLVGFFGYLKRKNELLKKSVIMELFNYRQLC